MVNLLQACITTQGDYTLEYDQKNRLIGVTKDGVNVATFVYDGDGNRVVGYAYDASGNRTALIYPDEKEVTYTYDALGRLVEVQDWAEQVTGYAYDVTGNLVSTDLPNGVTSAYGYDGLGRLASLAHATSAGVLSYYDYAYDAAGNRTQVTERVRQPGEPLDTIFADSVELDSFAAWSAHTEQPELSVEEDAALAGSYGIQVNINNTPSPYTGQLYVTDDSPISETHYFARFYFDPNSISMANGDAHQIFQAQQVSEGTALTVMKIHFRKSGTAYYIDAYVRKDNGAWLLAISGQITDAVHAIEIEWQAASGAGQNDGKLTLWVDDTQIGTRPSIDNDTHRIDKIKMGAVGAPNVGTQGVYCFDAFASRREGRIGLESEAHDCGKQGESFAELAILESTLPMVEITGTVPVTGSVVVLTATLPVTSSLEVQPNLIVDTIDLVEIVIAGVLSDTAPVTITGILSPTLQADSLMPYVLLLEEEIEEEAPPAPWSQVVQIDYTYDALSRLTQASYSNGRSFTYEHDAVGNRLEQEVCLPPAECMETVYVYDDANRLTQVGVIDYTWDGNGNLLSDGQYVYSYDEANRMVGAGPKIGFTHAEYQYNGLGDRVQQALIEWESQSVTTHYTLDLASGLTQVLADDQGTTYLYGQGRVMQDDNKVARYSPKYFLGDALGSVRQMANANGDVILAKAYQPYGEVLSSAGAAGTAYGFTGEMTDLMTEYIYLRARYYSPSVGRFTSRDTWQGSQPRPISYNAWLYTYANPVNLTDPTGNIPSSDGFLIDGYIRGNIFNITTGLGYGGLNLLNGLKIPLWGGGYLPLMPSLMSACFPWGDMFNVVGIGEETVYDFRHRQKQVFDILYVGTDFLQLMGLEWSFYEGVTSGFRNTNAVEQYGGLSISVAPPLGLSLGASLLEIGMGFQSNIAVSKPGVDSVVIGGGAEVGIGLPGVGFEEGAIGSYIAIVSATPRGRSIDFDSFEDLAKELHQASWISSDLLIEAARVWWNVESIEDYQLTYLPLINLGEPLHTIYLPYLTR